MVTKDEYEKAIETIKLAMTQLEPDGRSCVICEDIGHQAWECHFNPMVNHIRYWDALNMWQCYHCGEIFVSDDQAAEHFGPHGEWPVPVCRQRCSGFKVFPSGRKCEGCPDCSVAYKEMG